MKTPLMSVIMPVYNGENYLEKSINSILNQTFIDFELIIINDGSTDKSSLLCNNYASNNKQVKVFHIPNGGVSNARNCGINNSTGKFICFLDCDDEVTKYYLADLYNHFSLINQPCLIIQNYNLNKTEYIVDIDSENYYIEHKNNMVLRFIEDKLMRFSGPVGKLFERRIIIENKIYFPNGVHMGEDAIFILRYLLYVDYLLFANINNYIIHRTEGSLSQTYNNFDSEWLGYKLWKDAFISFIIKYNYQFDNIEKIIWENTGMTLIRSIQSLCRSKHKITLKKQVKYLKSIPDAEFLMIKKYYKPTLIRRKTNAFLLNNKLFTIYCTLGNIFKKISD